MSLTDLRSIISELVQHQCLRNNDSVFDFLTRNQVYGNNVQGTHSIIRISGEALFMATHQRIITEMDELVNQGIRNLNNQIEQQLFVQLENQIDTNPYNQRFNTSDPLQDSIINAATDISREGGRPDTVLLNNRNYLELQHQLAEQVSIRDFQGTNILQIAGPTSVMNVVASSHVPLDTAYILQSDTLGIDYMGDRVSVSEANVSPTTDDVEIRLSAYTNLVAAQPRTRLEGLAAWLPETQPIMQEESYNISERCYEPENQNRTHCLFCEAPLVNINTKKVCPECDVLHNVSFETASI